MPDHQRDPYASPPPPRERRGPMVRFAVVAVLLGAAAWAYMTYSQGPGLIQEAKEERPSSVADAGSARGYAAPRAPIPDATAPPAAPRATPPPADLPPPTTNTIPPA